MIAYHSEVPHGVADIFPDAGSLIVSVKKRFFDTAGDIPRLTCDSEAPAGNFFFRVIEFFSGPLS